MRSSDMFTVVACVCRKCNVVFALFLSSALVLLASGCGDPTQTLAVPSPPSTLTASAVFSSRMLGQTWTFQSNLGDHTIIVVEAPGPSDFLPANCISWHYTKDRARAYWQPAASGAEQDFVICPQNDGSWYAVAALFRGDTSSAHNPAPWIATQNIQPVAGAARGYLIIPALDGVDKVAQVMTTYHNFHLDGIETFNSILSNPATQTWDVTWRTDAYVKQTCVAYHNWCGNALISEQWEACDTSTWSIGSSCVHERWYFAPAMGLVRVDVLNVGFGEGGQFCALDMGSIQCYTPAQISFERVS